MVIDDKYLDYYFPDDFNYVFGDLGCASLADLCCGNYGDSVPELSGSEIDAAIEKIDAAGGGAERLVTRIYNQKSEGSCVANACSQAHEVVQARQFGKDRVVHLSAMSLYKRIGRSPGSGAMVSDGLEEMTSRGILPLDNEENRKRFGDHVMSNTGWSNKYPDDWESTAKKFSGAEFFVVKNVNQLLTALVNQHPVVVGREGHSICYLRATLKNGKRTVVYANSWGEWGSAAGDFDKGFGFDSESQIRKSASWAFALRSVVIPK